MLDRLSAIKDITRARPLLQVLLKLFRLCVKVQRNQEVLTQPELSAIGIFLGILQLCLAGETDASQAAITEQLLDVSLQLLLSHLYIKSTVLNHSLHCVQKETSPFAAAG
jgi:E3 ubiquitin-protein ligase UBR4